MELGQLKSKMGEENQRYKSLEEHLTAKGNEFDALKKEHNDALLKKEATSDRKLVITTSTFILCASQWCSDVVF